MIARQQGQQRQRCRGVAVSADGKWVFIGGWGPKTIMRVSRGVDPVSVDVVDTGVLTGQRHLGR